VFLEQLINGITLGSIYAIVALGYTLVFGVLGIINMAHGEIFMFGAFVGLLIVSKAGAEGILLRLRPRDGEDRPLLTVQGTAPRAADQGILPRPRVASASAFATSTRSSRTNPAMKKNASERIAMR
jgi:ABC-type branched-subunit amino acid transport system permease subunit